MEEKNKEDIITKEEFEEAQKEKDNTIKELEERLRVEQEKERNFKGVDKKIKKTEKEKSALELRIEALETEKKEALDKQVESLKGRKDTLLERLTNGDDDLKEKIEFFYERFDGEVLDEKTLEERLQDAALLAKSRSGNQEDSRREVFGSVHGAGGGVSSYKEIKSESDFADSDEGLDLAKRLGLNYPKIKEDK